MNATNAPTMASAPGLKICGIRRYEDFAGCNRLGVDAVGLNLWRGSKRALTIEQAEHMLAPATQHACLRVGVFVDPRAEEVADAVARLHLDLVQFHGDAPVDRYAGLGFPYVWVIRGTPAVETLRVPTPAPAWVLLDAHVPGQFGGSGGVTSWPWAAGIVRALAPLPVWLAGGLHAGNSADALDHVKPAGLDVASGAELDGAQHGEKDLGKVAALLAICKNRTPR